MGPYLWLPALVQRGARHRDVRDRIGLQSRRGRAPGNAVSKDNRLGQGGRIDRRRPLRFTFNGKPYEGYAGDTLASALLANGVTLIARSWKYHRPRGIVAA